jgi:hypothetical protein
MATVAEANKIREIADIERGCVNFTAALHCTGERWKKIKLENFSCNATSQLIQHL